MKKEVYCKLEIEGTHQWADCPIDEVSYLRNEHRHLFGIKCYKKVNHNDRDTEFIYLKHKIEKYLKDKYYDDTLKLCRFGGMSCEMIAEELINEFNLTRCEVSEDWENGAILTNDNF